MTDRVLKAHKLSATQFVSKFASTIQDHDVPVRSLVLVRNSRIEKELNRKTKARFLGPMVVVRRTKGGSYILADLDGAVSRLRYAAFCIIPYSTRSSDDISITSLLSGADLEDVVLRSEAYPPADDPADVEDYPPEDLD